MGTSRRKGRPDCRHLGIRPRNYTEILWKPAHLSPAIAGFAARAGGQQLVQESGLLARVLEAHPVEPNLARGLDVAWIDRQHALEVQIGLIVLAGTAQHERLVVV